MLEIKTNYSLFNRLTIPDPHTDGERRQSAAEALATKEAAALADGFKRTPTQKVLSLQELDMLHMLFGAARPQEMETYGKSRLQQIHKGQLIDLVG